MQRSILALLLLLGGGLLPLVGTSADPEAVANDSALTDHDWLLQVAATNADNQGIPLILPM